MCRREKDIMGKKLPPLERKVINVPVRPSELAVYFTNFTLVYFTNTYFRTDLHRHF